MSWPGRWKRRKKRAPHGWTVIVSGKVDQKFLSRMRELRVPVIQRR